MGSGGQQGRARERTCRSSRSTRSTSKGDPRPKVSGVTWSGFSCTLDTDNGYGCPPSDLAGCGLHKTEGAPLWHGRRKGWASAAACADWTRQASSPTSVFSRIPTEIAFGNDTYADVAQFLLARGLYGYQSSRSM